MSLSMTQEVCSSYPVSSFSWHSQQYLCRWLKKSVRHILCRVSCDIHSCLFVDNARNLFITSWTFSSGKGRASSTILIQHAACSFKVLHLLGNVTFVRCFLAIKKNGRIPLRNSWSNTFWQERRALGLCKSCYVHNRHRITQTLLVEWAGALESQLAVIRRNWPTPIVTYIAGHYWKGKMEMF